MFKQESGFGLEVSGEEVYVGSVVDWEGMCGEYRMEGSNVANSIGLLESEFVTSHEAGGFWMLVFFPVL